MLHKWGSLQELSNIKGIVTILRGQSIDSEFFLLLTPPGLAMYEPVIKFTIPCPPLVPGSQAAITAVD